MALSQILHPFFLDNKWWLVRLGDGRIGFIGVDVVIDKNDIKIATIIEEEEIRVTDDSEVVNAFSEFMNTPDE